MTFCKMTVFIILLLYFIKLCLGSPFSQVSKSLHSNHDSGLVDNTSTITRVKRYTRWNGATVQASAEFLVQIFDGDLPASSPSLVPDVMPFEQRLGKLQLGSVMMPTRTTLATQTATEPTEYTRFMPPKDKILRSGDLTIDRKYSDTNSLIQYPLTVPKIQKKLVDHHEEIAPIRDGGDIKNALVMTEEDGDDEEVPVIEIEKFLPEVNDKPYLRAIQYTAVPVSAREQHANLTNAAKPARISTIRSIVLPPLQSSKFFAKKTTIDTFGGSERTKFKIIKKSTRLKYPTHSTRLNTEYDDEKTDYEDTDKGGNDPIKELGDYEENNEEAEYDDNTNKVPPRPKLKPSIDQDQDQEDDEYNLTTHSAKSGKRTSSIRTSTKIYWGSYDDYSDEELTTKAPNNIDGTTGSRDQITMNQTKTRFHSTGSHTTITNHADDRTNINDSDSNCITENTDNSSDYSDPMDSTDTAVDRIKSRTSTMANITIKTQKTLKTTKSGTTTRFTYPAERYPIPHGDCKIIQDKSFTFVSHHTLAEIMSQLKKWGESSVAKLVDISKVNQTHMLNSIHMLVVDDRSHGQDSMAKQTVLIVAGLQGRDHYAVSAAMYLLFELIDRSKHHMDLLSQYRFWIIPIFNPDGYEYTTSFPEARNWKKNLKQTWEKRESCQKHGIHCVLTDCMGVHLDRNFEYQWISGMDTHPVHPCSGLYPGERQLSEPETVALSRLLRGANAPVFSFVALKEGNLRGILYPYSHTKNNRASDSSHRLRAGNAATAAKSIAGRKYVHGQVSEFLPLYAGGVEDWMEGHHGVDNSYTIMLDQPDGNITIETISQEVFAAVDTILLTKNPPLVLTFNAPQDSAGAGRHPLGWAWLRRCSMLATVDILKQISVICLYFVFCFIVTSILRIIESTP